MKSFIAPILLLGIAFLVSSPAHSEETVPKYIPQAINTERMQKIEAFMQILTGAKPPNVEDETLLSTGLNDVKACLNNSEKYKRISMPLTSFIQRVGKDFSVNENKDLPNPILYVDYDPYTGNPQTNGHSFVAVINLERDAVQPSLLIVFFQFAPNKSVFISAPVIMKSASTVSLFDLALAERDRPKN